MARTYAQNCGLARALDILGERWTLLLIRELELGPRRFKDLASALPAMGTNLLATRLEALESAGVIGRLESSTSAGRGYELTAAGRALTPVLRELAVWGLDHGAPHSVDRATRASWAATAMFEVGNAPIPRELRQIVEVHSGDEDFWVEPQESGVLVRHGAPPAAAAASLTCEPSTFFALADGSLSMDAAAEQGLAEIVGDRSLAARIFEHFRIPTTQQQEL